MAFTFNFYSDSGLVNALTQIQGRNLSDDSTPANDNDQVIYLGSTETGKKARATSDPGTDPIELTPAYAVTAWSTGATIALDDIVMPTSNNGYKYQAQNGGTTHASTEPTWPTTIGQTVNDNGITWECIDELHQPNEITLGASAAELDINTPGAALNLGTQILSGVGNATTIHIRLNQDAHPVGTFVDLKMVLTELDEEDV